MFVYTSLMHSHAKVHICEGSVSVITQKLSNKRTLNFRKKSWYYIKMLFKIRKGLLWKETVTNASARVLTGMVARSPLARVTRKFQLSVHMQHVLGHMTVLKLLAGGMFWRVAGPSNTDHATFVRWTCVRADIIRKLPNAFPSRMSSLQNRELVSHGTHTHDVPFISSYQLDAILKWISALAHYKPAKHGTTQSFRDWVAAGA